MSIYYAVPLYKVVRPCYLSSDCNLTRGRCDGSIRILMVKRQVMHQHPFNSKSSTKTAWFINILYPSSQGDCSVVRVHLESQAGITSKGFAPVVVLRNLLSSHCTWSSPRTLDFVRYRFLHLSLYNHKVLYAGKQIHW